MNSSFNFPHYYWFKTVNTPENGAEPYSSGIALLPLLLMN
jgi:hypothetical protein